MDKTAIQELAPYIEAFPANMKDGKAKTRHTNQTLSDASGVPVSNIGKLFSGHLPDPKLFNSVAVCKVLGMSLDRLFGLEEKKPAREEDKDLRDENKELRYRIRELEKDLAHERQLTEERRKSMRTRFTFTYVLLALSLVLAVSILYYLDYDSSIPHGGLITQGNASIFSALLMLAVLAVVAIGIALVVQHIIAKRRAK